LKLVKKYVQKPCKTQINIQLRTQGVNQIIERQKKKKICLPSILLLNFCVDLELRDRKIFPERFCSSTIEEKVLSALHIWNP